VSRYDLLITHSIYTEKMDTGMASASEREVKCVRKREIGRAEIEKEDNGDTI
jgi:hypothetical protein